MSDATARRIAEVWDLPRAAMTANGARLVCEVWTRLHRLPDIGAPGTASAGELLATAGTTSGVPVEAAAHANAWRMGHAWTGRDNELRFVCLSVPVFAATALAEARRIGTERLFQAVGMALEFHSRLIPAVSDGMRDRGFRSEVLCAGLSGIVACAVVEDLSVDQAAQAVGLGSSALTGAAVGDLPLQIAVAARDAVVMALLMSCGFRGPPDPLGCRWGVFEVFAQARGVALTHRGAGVLNTAREIEEIFGAWSCSANVDALAAVTLDELLARLAA